MQQEQVRLLTKLLTAAHRNKLMSQEPLQTDICVHILSVSAGMVGVCLTVIGLFRVITELKSVDSIGDNLLAVDALAFLTSFILSYIALRTRGNKRNHRLEKIADAIFFTALVTMVVICGLIAYAFV